VAVNDLSLQLQPGEVFGFVGSNGAGKTTTMRVVLGTLTPDAGKVLWDGAPIGFEVRRRIGYMPEERGLYPKMRIGEQLIYLAQLHGSTHAAAAAAVALWLERFHLKDRTRDELQKLSHGNQQRVQLAAALVFEPLMLVLDEPFAGLDPEAVDSMTEVLRERARSGIPVIFSSHQLELVERLCDAVVLIDQGRIAAQGTIEELRVSRARNLWQIRLRDVTSPWWEVIPGAAPLRRDDGVVVLELAPSTDPQRVLDVARSAGDVLSFGPVEPSLQELFREVVS